MFSIELITADILDGLSLGTTVVMVLYAPHPLMLSALSLNEYVSPAVTPVEITVFSASDLDGFPIIDVQIPVA